MSSLRNAAAKLLWPSVLGLLLALVVAVVLLIAGSSDAAIIAGAVGAVLAIPALAAAFARPRAGLVWEGSYAEPWRSERSPGEPATRDEP